MKELIFMAVALLAGIGAFALIVKKFHSDCIP